MEVLFTYLDHGLLVLLNATGQPLLLQTNILTQFLRRFIGGGEESQVTLPSLFDCHAPLPLHMSSASVSPFSISSEDTGYNATSVPWRATRRVPRPFSPLAAPPNGLFPPKRPQTNALASPFLVRRGPALLSSHSQPHHGNKLEDTK